MKLGICYMVFDGIELLEANVKRIRNNIDYISVTYQDVSYFGNPADPELFETLDRLKSQGLIDEMIPYKTDLTIHHKENELNLRNLGLEFSRKAGCTHHISSDVDEFYIPEELEYAKKYVEDGDYNYSVVYISTYYKEPTYLVYPEQTLMVSFIHPVSNQYTRTLDYPIFPYHMETTRRFVNYDKSCVIPKEKCVQHHMSYIRKDIRKKFANSDNAQFYRLKKFYETYDNYTLGSRVCLLPDYLNRRTIEVPNRFNIDIKS